MKKLIKKLLILTIIAAMVVTAMPLTGIGFAELLKLNVFAIDEIEEETEEPQSYEFQYGDFYCLKTKSDTVTIYKYTGSDTVVEIPSEINGYPVTWLGQYSFSPRSNPANDNVNKNDALYNLKKVVVPPSVEVINAHAFIHCTSLETVILPEGLKQIYDMAFAFCSSLETIEFPESLNSIGFECFNKSGVKEVVFKKNPSNKFSVGRNAFSHSNIKKCTFQSDNTLINYDAFRYSVVEEVVFEGSLSYNSSWDAFNNADSVQKIVFLSKILLADYAETLVNENGFYLHINTEDDYIYFDRNPDDTDLLTSGDFVYGINAENEAVVLGYNGTNSDVVVPETLDGHTVTEIGPYAFNNWIYEFEENRDNTFITSVTIPETVTTIGSYAFCNNRRLATVNFYENLEVIEEYAFGLSGITEAVIPESVKSIGIMAFAECPQLEYVVIPESITELKIGTFNACPELKKVTLPEGLEKIEDYCFSETTLLTDINIPSTVKEIGEYAFFSCGIEDIVLSENLEFLGEYAFSLSGAESAVVSGKNLTIPEQAFSYSRQLKTLELLNGVKEIGEYAFYECTALETVTIPESVEKLNLAPFRKCTALTTVYYNAVHAEVAEGTIGGSISFPKKPVFYETENIKEIFIGDKVEYLGKRLFAGITNLETVHMSDSVKVIAASAFYNCQKLEAITLPANLEKMASGAFNNCYSLKTVTVPAGLKKMSVDTFKGCPLEIINYYPAECELQFGQVESEDGVLYSPFYRFRNTLKEINLGSEFTEIPDNYFSGLVNLTKVTVPDTIKTIGSYAFYDCGSLENFEVSDKTEEIGSYAFYGCKLLKNIDIPSSIKDLNEYCFAYTATESFFASSVLESIGDGCFKGCSQLAEISLGNVMIIGESAFEDCVSITKAIIPDSVSTVGKRAFKNCDALITVYMSDNVNYIADECFYGCTTLNEFVWESKSKLIGIRSFAYCTSLNEFDFENLKKLYDNSFLNSGVTVAQLGEGNNETASELKEIEVQSFMDCDNLATLGIGGNVTTIKTQAFANCENLETAVIADSVTEIAEDAFDGCDKLTIYCSENSYAHTYAQTQGIRVSTLVIAPIPNQTYTGFEIKPEISVSASGDTLDKNIDFSVSYANNVNVGNADVNVKGLGDFRMFASRAMFTIVTKNISAVTVSPIADQPYTGSAITPELTVTDGLKVLNEGKDYTVTFSNNVNEGTATAKITGIGNYSGTATADFVISKEAEEPSFFEKIISTISSFFAKVVSFFVSIFM